MSKETELPDLDLLDDLLPDVVPAGGRSNVETKHRQSTSTSAAGELDVSADFPRNAGAAPVPVASERRRTEQLP
jgi:hypothetical protein